ncbi:MAG: CDP-alcohol phosphatidyltransferase family protein [Candidatus Eisenbacteria bacterium]|nr:CDP-alcohol phosphatidyltransferase family protein [Candidatus Eisenbacteria bacterium]
MAVKGIKARARSVLDPVARFAADVGVTPAGLTLAGLALSGLAGFSIAHGRFPVAGVLLVLAGVCDMLDGAVARLSNRTSDEGAFLDSTVDRYAEAVVLLGALHYYLFRSATAPETATAIAIFLAFWGSLLVSYTRARAEGLGRSCTVGIAERPERVVLLIVGALLGSGVMRIVLWVLVVLTHLTALQRILHVLYAGGGRPRS